MFRPQQTAELLVQEFGDFENGFLEGSQCASSLRAIGDLIDPIYAEYVCTVLNTAADKLEKGADPRKLNKDRGNLRRIYTLRPLYSLLEGGLYTSEASTLRALIFLAIVRALAEEQRSNSKSIAGSLAPVVRKLRDSGASDQYSQLKTLLARPTGLLINESFVKELSNRVADDDVAGELSADRLRLLRQVISVSSIHPKPDDISIELELDEPDIDSPADIQYQIIDEESVNSELLEGGLAIGDATDVQSVVSVRFKRKIRRDLARIIATRAQFLCFTKAPDPTLGNCLLDAEAAGYSSLLLERVRREENPIKRDAFLLLLLQLVTAQRLESLAALVWSSTTAQPGTITIDGDFTVNIPYYDKFVSLPESLTEYTNYGVVPLPLPSIILGHLEKGICHNGSRVFASASPEEIATAAKLELRLIRNQMDRVTVDRVTSSLPTYVFLENRDPREMQLLCGSNLGLPPWPLFYYAPKVSYLRHVYSRVTHRLLGQKEPYQVTGRYDHDDVIVGSALGAAIELPRKIIRALEDGVEIHSPARKRGRWNSKEWLIYLNILSMKTAWMFSCVTGFRNTNEIGRIRRSDMNLEGAHPCVIVGDKLSEESGRISGHRICSLGLDIVPTQIKALLRAYAYFYKAAVGIPELEQARCMVGLALSGESGLFLDFSEGVSPGSTKWLQSGSPEEGVPVNLFRHILATSFTRIGGNPADLFHQLGHTYFAEMQLGDLSGDSPAYFLKRAANIVERVVQDLGWSPTHVTPTWSYPSPDLQSLCALYAQAIKENKEAIEFARRRSLLQEEIDEKVEELLADEVIVNGRVLCSEIDFLERLEALLSYPAKHRDYKGYKKKAVKKAMADWEDDEVSSFEVRAKQDFKESFVQPVDFLAWNIISALRLQKSNWDLQSSQKRETDGLSALEGLVSVCMDLLLYHPIEPPRKARRPFTLSQAAMS